MSNRVAPAFGSSLSSRARSSAFAFTAVLFVVLAAGATPASAARVDAPSGASCSSACDRKAAECLDACEERFKDDARARVTCKVDCATARQACDKNCN
jgi:hypothetical protein